MSLFKKPLVLLWPKSTSLEIYLDKKDENYFSFDLNLWKALPDSELLPLFNFLKSNKISSLHLLLPDDVYPSKSFLYDSKIESIDQSELISLAESFISFKIEANSIQYQLLPTKDKTLILSQILDQQKFQVLLQNLTKLGLSVESYQSVSSSIAKVFAQFNQDEYFLAYPVSQTEYSLFLAKGDTVYLSTLLKNNSPDLQKTLNYSKLYFQKEVNKIYLPSSPQLELNLKSTMDKTEYDSKQIALKSGKASNIPLAALSFFTSTQSLPKQALPELKVPSPQLTPPPVSITETKTPEESPQPVIINKSPDTNLSKNMESKKNILPLIAVFIFTAALASVVIWYVLNRNSETALPVSPTTEEITPVAEVPTLTPTPALVALEKDLKLQVLNATDINGQAATLKQSLTKLGYTSVAVGNATTNETTNQIQMKAEYASSSAYLKDQLSGTFDATITTDLDEDSSYDLIFIIGTDLSESETDTASSNSDSQ